MGTVYRAQDERLGKTVALKVLSDTRTPADSHKRFRHEARAAAILNHPSIVSVYDYDEQEGTPFIVYEYVEGKTIDRLISEGELPESEIVEIGAQVAEALAYAHDQGILHRDVKPQNIIVTDPGRAKILDFGLAKRTLEFIRSDGGAFESTTVATAAGTIVGTVQYMSPEQIAGEQLDPRTDIFSLGIVLYEMAVGVNPFQGQSFASTVGKIMAPEPPPFPATSLKRSSDLQAIISKCLKKKRDERYPNSRALLHDLQRLRTGTFRSFADVPVSVIPRTTARLFLILLQFLYIGIYATALYFHESVFWSLFFLVYESSTDIRLAFVVRGVWTVLLITGCVGIPVRLYLLASVGFDDPETGEQFRRLFPYLFVLDELWAMSPLLLINTWPAGIALICVATLAYLPMSQRTLVRSAYR
jgi:serine/threonine protein kinase